MIIDFHSHVLPGLDDGARDIATSMAILDKETADGVDMVIATPHYYPDEQSISEFVAKREDAYTKLINAAEDSPIPSIKLGAEVYFSPILQGMSNLHDLCIDGTDYLLLELPYQELSQKTIESIQNLIYSAGNIQFVIAHVERYLNFTSLESVETIMELDVLGQVNASSITDFHSRKMTLKLIKNNLVHVIGSDVHNTTTRSAQMGEAEKILSRKISKNIYPYFMSNAKMILKNQDIDDIL